MSSIRVLLLGALMDDKPRHGYEIRRVLESWNAEAWANIAYGSIYSALKKMAQEGLIKPVEGGSDDKVVYRITPDGKKYFLVLLRKYFWEEKPLIDPLQVGVAFMDYMPKEELIAALEMRANRQRFLAQQLDSVLPVKMKASGAPRHVAENFILFAGHAKAELEWIEQALEKIKAGKLP